MNILERTASSKNLLFNNKWKKGPSNNMKLKYSSFIKESFMRIQSEKLRRSNHMANDAYDIHLQVNKFCSITSQKVGL